MALSFESWINQPSVSTKVQDDADARHQFAKRSRCEREIGESGLLSPRFLVSGWASRSSRSRRTVQIGWPVPLLNRS